MKLASGTTLAQAVVLVTAPVITRLYDPSQFGAATLFASVSGILIVVGCLRYDLSIVLPESDEDGAAQLWLSLLLSLLLGAGAFAILSLLPASILGKVGADEIPFYSLLVGLAIVIGSGLSALTYWNSRKRRFGRVGAARVANTSVTALAQTGAGVLGGGSGALVVGSLAGTATATVLLAAQSALANGQVLARNLRFGRMLSGARQHWRFPVFNTWSALLNTMSWQLPALVLGVYFGSATVGFYSLGYRVLALPMSMVGGAIAQVFYQHAAVSLRAGGLRSLVQGVFSVLVDLGLLPFATLAIAGKEVFIVAFGAQWAEAGVYVQILSIATFVTFVSSPMSTLYPVLDQQARALWLNAAILLSRLAALAIGGWVGSPSIALALFAATGLMLYGYMNQYIMTQSGVPLSAVGRIVGRACLRAVVPCVAIAALVVTGVGATWVFAACVVAIAANTLWMVRRWRDLLRSGKSPASDAPTGATAS